MDYTENLNLPQFAEADRIHHDDFNDAMSKIDAAVPRIVTGTYTGDGAASRTISLGFAPKAVLVFDSYGKTHDEGTNGYYYGGLALQNNPVFFPEYGNALEISSNGFVIANRLSYETAVPKYCLNVSGEQYYYIALA